MQTLINRVVQDEPEMCKMDAILYLLQCNSISSHVPAIDPHNSAHEKELGNEKGTAKINIGKMLKNNMAKFIKYFNDFPDNVRIEELLRTHLEDANDELISKLNALIETLTIIQVAKRVNATRLELKKLRLDKNETRRLFEQKEDLDRCILKIGEREAEKRNIEDEIVIANQFKDILEDKRQETEAENVFYNVSISESEKSLEEAQRRERKEVKHFKDTENNVCNLRRLILEEKQKLAEMRQKMKQVNQDQLEIEVCFSFDYIIISFGKM
ncbi:hypothetical protein M9H77_06481 [Catharanthus roseus]|uniref:Uncharacterized protein n=1 Tax=Catharanthus roseus TaxID=4058 RepID=A0ACC0BSA3_CATRO|nr:hypothetical protein M9H77_06481 [Catharanthus roseus]